VFAVLAVVTGAVVQVYATASPAQAAATGMSLSVLDPTGFAYGKTSTAIGPDGLPVIAYIRQDGNGGSDLRLAHCQDVACATFVTHTVDQIGLPSPELSMKIGSDGVPVMAYLTQTCCNSEHIYVSHCVDLVCSSASHFNVDAVANVHGMLSLAIGGDGMPLVSYEDTWVDIGSTDQVVKVAHCLNRDCTSLRINQIAQTGGGFMAASAIAVGPNGLGVVAFHDQRQGSQKLRVTACGNADCSSGNVTTNLDVAPTGHDTGAFPSIAIGSDNLPLISYTDDFTGVPDLRVTHCTNVSCTGSTAIVADSGGTGGYTVTAKGADGLGLITYYDLFQQQVRIMHCTTITCGSPTKTTFNPLGDPNVFTSIVIGSDGLPLIGFARHSFTSGVSETGVAHCADVACTIPVPPPPAPDYGIGLSATAATVNSGQSATTTVTMNPVNGYIGTATLTTSALPAGVTATFNPATVTIGAPSTVVFSTSASTPGGTYPITVSADDGVQPPRIRTATYVLTVVGAPAPSFTLGASSTSGELTGNDSTAAILQLTPANGFTGPATLSASGQPKGVSVSFSSTTITAGSPVTVTVSDTNAANGTSKIAITATAGAIQSGVVFTLTIGGIVPPPPAA
jgi:hypothetical protein